MLLLGSNWYLGDTNWYLTIFTLFRRWLELEQQLRQHQRQQEVVVEVVGGRPLEEEDEHLAHLILGR